MKDPKLPAEIPLGSLRIGKRLGAGGQGEVLQLLSHSGMVFKRYYFTNVDAQSLRALVQFPESLQPAARDSLLSQAAWPRTCVTDGGRTTGFLMAEAPRQFIGMSAAGPKLRELQYLLFQPKPFWGDIKPLDAKGRVQAARAFVALVQLLHDHSVVLGDISMSNLLWCPGAPAKIFLIDCDSACKAGLPPVLRQPQTADWDDPTMPHTGPDLDSDRYKVALVVGRILAASYRVRPGEPLAFVPGLPENVAALARACFADAAGPRHSRPDLSRWEQALSAREMITLVPPQPPPPPVSQPMAPSNDERGPRESIQLRPPPMQPASALQLPMAPSDQRGTRESIPLNPPGVPPASVPPLPMAPSDERGLRESIPIRPIGEDPHQASETR